MKPSRLVTMLPALVLAPAALMSAQPAGAAVADEFTYCTSPYVIGQNPDCTPPPTPSADYRGEPVAVYNQKKVTGFEKYVYVNVLKNDAIQKRTRARVEITGQQPKATGVYAFVVDGKIRLRFEFEDMTGSGAIIRYHVVDSKGRTSNETYLDVTMKVV